MSGKAWTCTPIGMELELHVCSYHSCYASFQRLSATVRQAPMALSMEVYIVLNDNHKDNDKYYHYQLQIIYGYCETLICSALNGEYLRTASGTAVSCQQLIGFQ